MKGTRNVHVSREADGRRWRVSQDGRVLSRHLTQQTAIKAGRHAAKREHAELVTHGRDGQIRTKDSFGRESRRPDAER